MSGITVEALGKRLEAVRADAGLSLRAFWREVMGGEEGGPFEWSADAGDENPRYGYRTVARYHRGKREAPVEYVARVAEVFNVRVRWLVNGSGSMKRHPWEKGFIHHPLYRDLRERDFFESFPLIGLGDAWTFLDLHRAYEIHTRRHQPPGQGPGPLGRSDLGRAEDLRFLLRLPLVAWGYGHVRKVPVEYWRGVMGALQAAIRHFQELQPRKSGKLRKPREIREDPFIQIFREAYEGNPDSINEEEDDHAAD